METILIKNVNVISWGEHPTFLEGQDLLIEEGKISQMGANLDVSNYKSLKTIMGEGRLLMPGMVNAHTHFYSAFARGLTKAEPSANFTDVLNNLWWRLDKKLNLDDCYYSALVSCMECIRQGTTLVFDHHASPFAIDGILDHLAKAVTEVGMRASLCYEVSDRDGGEIAKQGLLENERFIKKVNTSPDPLLTAKMGLHALFTLSDETLNQAISIVNQLDSGIHIHLAEDQVDQLESQKKYQKSCVQRLYDLGALSAKALCGHGVHLSDDELKLLKEQGVFLVHNPQSNSNNAVGRANLKTWQQHGILSALGTDAMTTNMIEELRFALWSYKLNNEDPNAGFPEIMNLLVNGNFRLAASNWNEEFGVIKIGAPADLVLWNMPITTPISSENILGYLSYGFNQGRVDTVLVNGKLIMLQQEFVAIDEQEVYAKAREHCKDFWQRF